MANHGRTLQHLHGGELAGHALHGVIELLDAADGADLRHLRGHLCVVHGVGGVLVLQLGHQQGQKLILHGLGIGARGLGALVQRGAGVVDARNHVGLLSVQLY